MGGLCTVADISDLTARFNSAASTLISSVEQLTQFGPSETSKRSNVIGIFKTKECQEYVAFTFVAQMLRNEVHTLSHGLIVSAGCCMLHRAVAANGIVHAAY